MRIRTTPAMTLLSTTATVLLISLSGSAAQPTPAATQKIQFTDLQPVKWPMSPPCSGPCGACPMSQFGIGVKNAGTLAAGAFTVEVRFGPQVVHTARVAGLASGDHTAVGYSVEMLPCGPMPAPPQFISLAVDTKSEVGESNEGNNAQVVAQMFVPLPQPTKQVPKARIG